MKSLVLVTVAALLCAGCKSTPSEKPTLTRGWIGGEYGKADRYQVPKGESSRVFVKQVYPGTPAEKGGLKPGDLIVAIDGQAVRKLPDFRAHVDATTPGAKSTFKVLREGKPQELPLVVGRESYKQWHVFQIGFKGSTMLDLWPNPDFSVFGLIDFERSKDRLEFQSAGVTLERQKEQKPPEGRHSKEGWHTWFVIFGSGAHKEILKQETVSLAAGFSPEE